MLEDVRKLTNQINPESLDPNHVSRPPAEKPDEEKSRDYEDTPEFRKSLNMKVSRSVLHPIVIHVNNPWTLNAPKPKRQQSLLSLSFGAGNPLSCHLVDSECTEG